ncbi:hypothetical protein ACTA71_002685 [Dictyostelium dimigraforme]
MELFLLIIKRRLFEENTEKVYNPEEADGEKETDDEIFDIDRYGLNDEENEEIRNEEDEDSLCPTSSSSSTSSVKQHQFLTVHQAQTVYQAQAVYQVQETHQAPSVHQARAVCQVQVAHKTQAVCQAAHRAVHQVQARVSIKWYIVLRALISSTPATKTTITNSSVTRQPQQRVQAIVILVKVVGSISGSNISIWVLAAVQTLQARAVHKVPQDKEVVVVVVEVSICRSFCIEEVIKQVQVQPLGDQQKGILFSFDKEQTGQILYSQPNIVRLSKVDFHPLILPIFSNFRVYFPPIILKQDQDP